MIEHVSAQEIETAIEKAIRREVSKFCGKVGERTIEFILKHQETIPAYDFVRTCVNKVTIGPDLLTITLKPTGLKTKHEISKIDAKKAFELIGLGEKLTKNRRDGFVTVSERIKLLA